MSEAQFDPEAIYAYAAQTIDDAKHVTRNWSLMGALVGFIISITVVEPLSLPTLVVSVFAGAMGYVIGADRAASMRKDAQMALLQVKIEANTRAWISQSRVALHNLAQAAEQAVHAALAVESDRTGSNAALRETVERHNKPAPVPYRPKAEPVPAAPAAPLAAEADDELPAYAAAPSEPVAAVAPPLAADEDDGVPSYVDASHNDVASTPQDFQYLAWSRTPDGSNGESDEDEEDASEATINTLKSDTLVEFLSKDATDDDLDADDATPDEEASVGHTPDDVMLQEPADEADIDSSYYDDEYGYGSEEAEVEPEPVAAGASAGSGRPAGRVTKRSAGRARGGRKKSGRGRR